MAQEPMLPPLAECAAKSAVLTPMVKKELNHLPSWSKDTFSEEFPTMPPYTFSTYSVKFGPVNSSSCCFKLVMLALVTDFWPKDPSTSSNSASMISPSSSRSRAVGARNSATSPSTRAVARSSKCHTPPPRSQSARVASGSHPSW